MKNQKPQWSWVEGNIDATGEHIEIRYGRAELGSWEDWTRVVLVAPPDKHTFTVQFLLLDDGESTKRMLDATRKELDFYLVDKGEENPWGYAKYHCVSAANLYSNVHWSVFPRKEKAEPSAGGDAEDRAPQP